MPKIDNFPGIRRIALIIAYDNGMVNRTCTEQEFLASTDEVLGADGVDETDLRVLDEWASDLSDEAAIIVGAGEQRECAALESTCPKPELCGLFNDIFDGDDWRLSLVAKQGDCA